MQFGNRHTKKLSYRPKRNFIYKDDIYYAIQVCPSVRFEGSDTCDISIRTIDDEMIRATSSKNFVII
uniref:Uncharacterized protein n=1 Tax=Caenorhabditis japonica TaxID=281687 RepID=A0A8R1IH10_CAEJA